LTLGKAVFAECFAVPSVLHSVNKLFTEHRTLPNAALGKVLFVEFPIKSNRQSRRHSAKARILVVHKKHSAKPPALGKGSDSGSGGAVQLT
jgi:hypothetical protein